MRAIWTKPVRSTEGYKHPAIEVGTCLRYGDADTDGENFETYVTRGEEQTI